MIDKKNKSAILGIMITAGSAIGAGMFSLPVVSSGMWFSYSLVILVVIWYLNYLSSLMVLEVNLQYDRGASFDTFVTALLGKTWNFLTGISIAFLLYILLYAYFSAFGNMVSHTIGWTPSEGDRWSTGLMSLGVGTILALLIWKSTKVVGRISTILVVGMMAAFIVSMSGLTLYVEMGNLFKIEYQNDSLFSYTWAALPYYLTSFGFSSVVPSLYKYYGNRPQVIKKGLFYGSLLALIVYTLFLFIIFGIIPREEFIAINEAGGNMGTLVGALLHKTDTGTLKMALNIFSNFAIISSFLGVGLSLFDYIADKFKFSNQSGGRFYTTMITFLPPGIASFFFPHGFIAAIGFAGLVMYFVYFLVPFMMTWKTRSQLEQGAYRVFGGRPLLLAVVAISTIVMVCHILAMMDYLPKF